MVFMVACSFQVTGCWGIASVLDLNRNGHVRFEYVHWGIAMPRAAVEDNSRMSLRIRPEDKTLLLRAVAFEHTDLTDFVVRHAVRGAKDVIHGKKQGGG